MRLTGGGVLLATDEERSAVSIDADRVRVDHLTYELQPPHAGGWGTTK